MAVTQSGQKVIKFGAAADAVTGHKLVKFIHWTAATAAKSFVVTDTAGNEVCRALSTTYQLTFHFDMGCLPMDGIIISAMGDGTALVGIE